MLLIVVAYILGKGDVISQIFRDSQVCLGLQPGYETTTPPIGESQDWILTSTSERGTDLPTDGICWGIYLTQLDPRGLDGTNSIFTYMNGYFFNGKCR